eukprot:gene7359-biopygen13574
MYCCTHALERHFFGRLSRVPGCQRSLEHTATRAPPRQAKFLSPHLRSPLPLASGFGAAPTLQIDPRTAFGLQPRRQKVFQGIPHACGTAFFTGSSKPAQLGVFGTNNHPKPTNTAILFGDNSNNNALAGAGELNLGHRRRRKTHFEHRRHRKWKTNRHRRHRDFI